MTTANLNGSRIQEPSTSGRFNLREKKEAVRLEFSRLCSCLIVNALFGALASTGVLAAQEPAKKTTAQDSGFVLRQTVRRVRVDVVVTDAQGHLVTGLKESDFRVAEDGKSQAIRQFEYHSDEKAEATFTKRPPLPPHTFMNLPTAQEHGPLTVVLYDLLNTQIGDQLSARTQMVKFLKKSAGRRIAVFAIGDRLRLLQGFTSDTDLLLQAVNQTGTSSPMGYCAELTGFPTNGAMAMGGPVDTGSAGGSTVRMSDADAFASRVATREENSKEAEASQLLNQRVETTLDALVQIGRFLEGLPGRKNLIWYSGSFPIGIFADPDKMKRSFERGGLERDDSATNYSERIREATDRLNTAEVSIYPVDARGLLGSSPPAPPFVIRSTEFATMNLLGDQTGGKAFYSTNALEEALETAADEGSSYYSFVYAPTNMKFDGSVRSISVHLGQGRYHLAYRRSYIADDVASSAHKPGAADQNATSSDQASVSAESIAAATQFGAPLSRQLVFAARVDAIGTPALATAEQMASLAPYREQAAKAEHRKFVQPTTLVPMQQYAIQYGVLVSQLKIPKSADGVYHSDFSMVALAFNQDGETLWGTKTRLKDDIPASKIDSIRKDGFRAMQSFSVPAETAVIRLVVCDEHSGQIGSMEVRLPLPPDEQQAVRAQ